MKTNTIFQRLLLLIVVSLYACGADQNSHPHNGESHDHHDHPNEHIEWVELTAEQVEMLELKMGAVSQKNLSEFVRTNGRLEVPPQNKATVTAIIGANVQSVAVIPGQDVAKGQVLATISHPDLIKIQTEYATLFSELDYLESEEARQKRLYEEEVGSGKEYRKVKTEYLKAKGNLAGLESQLKQLNLDPKAIAEGKIWESVNVVSPISGSVRSIQVNLGQYVAPEMTLFEVIDNHHIHVDLLVYEKDIAKIEKGQKVLFHIESAPKQEFEAVIFAVGSSFEEKQKAVSVHAEILGDKPSALLPGMYVKGRIMLGSEQRGAVPTEAVVRDESQQLIFSVEEVEEAGKTMYRFEPIPVLVGVEEGGWLEVESKALNQPDLRIALNQAYFLLAEMQKGEGGHDH
jgi:cobalt-zinc-cadmium efflux system membrane fusion protein